MRHRPCRKPTRTCWRGSRSSTRVTANCRHSGHLRSRRPSQASAGAGVYRRHVRSPGAVGPLRRRRGPVPDSSPTARTCWMNSASSWRAVSARWPRERHRGRWSDEGRAGSDPRHRALLGGDAARGVVGPTMRRLRHRVLLSAQRLSSLLVDERHVGARLGPSAAPHLRDQPSTRGGLRAGRALRHRRRRTRGGSTDDVEHCRCRQHPRSARTRHGARGGLRASRRPDVPVFRPERTP